MATTTLPAIDLSFTGLGNLISSARRGNSSALGMLAERFGGPIYGAALRITRSPEDAEDVRQETFLRVQTHLDGFEEGGNFGGWVGRIAINESITALRRRHSKRLLPLDDCVSHDDENSHPRDIASRRLDPERRYAVVERRRILARAIEELEPHLRSVCLMRDIKNLSTRETARHLGLTSATVRTRLFRGRSKLRRRLIELLTPARLRAAEAKYGCA
ncbi:MAG: RNA polymerase sigma factor [Candidatus Acidiferrales bacterium]